jgi:hypothetical protein
VAAPEPVDLSFVATDVWGGSTLMWATPFTDVKNLVDQAIAKLKPGQCIRRFIIAGHGAEKTDGFFVFDPDLSGAQLIDGGAKREPISPSVVKELQRLKLHFCKDAIIEFRVCRMGSGTNGKKAMQAVADAVGIPVTAPMDEIKGIAAVGGLTVDWRVAYPTAWGVPSSFSFWRGEPTLPPEGAPSPTTVAPVTGQVVPLRSVTTPPTPGQVLPPVRKVSYVNLVTQRHRRRRFASVGALAVGGGLAAFGGWILLNATPAPPGVGLASPSPSPTPSLTAAPTLQPTQPPTPSPTASPTRPPTPTPISIVIPADGTYLGSGMFRSYDGETSFDTAWRVIKAGANGEIAQLVRVGGEPFQVLQGVVLPSGLFVAVSDDPNFCEVIILEPDSEQWLDEMFVAYGPASMPCPDAAEVAPWYASLDGRPEAHEAEFRSRYNWGNDVVIGSVMTDGWTPDG